VPVALIEKPEIEEVPALETFTKRPSGVIAFQQLAAPRVGTLALIAVTVPCAATAYEEIAAVLPPGPVSADNDETLRREGGCESAGTDTLRGGELRELSIRFDAEDIDLVRGSLRNEQSLAIGAEDD
jgi:hypothetical protein